MMMNAVRKLQHTGLLFFLVLLPWFCCNAQQNAFALNLTAAGSITVGDGGGGSGPRTPTELLSQLLEGYDPLARPAQALAIQNGTLSGTDPPPPDVARIQLHVISLNDVEQKRNEYELTAWLRVSWHDHRLQYASASRGGCFPDDFRVGYDESTLAKLWSPDMYIKNQAKPSKWVTGAFWIYPSGRVIHVSQLNMVLACQMEFVDFPRDVQNCGIRIRTWLEDARSVTVDFYEDLPPVTLEEITNGGKSLASGGTTEWEIVGSKGVYTTGVGGNTQEQSSVEIHLQLARNSEYYNDFVIVPATMFVAIGWLSSFIGRGAAPARVAMSMIGFLANSNFLAAQLGQLPRLGNDVWMLSFLSISSWFSFYAVLEYVICNWLRRIESRIEGARKRTQEVVTARQANADKNGHADEEVAEQPLTVAVTKKDMVENGFNYKMDLLMMRNDAQMYFSDEHVEIFSRYVYPIAYMVCVLVFWYAK